MQDTVLIIKIAVTVIGAIAVVVPFILLSLRKLYANLALMMILTGISFILAGKLPAKAGLVFAIISALWILYGALRIMMLISELITRNQELAVHVSLLNEENEKIQRKLAEITGEDPTDF